MSEIETSNTNGCNKGVLHYYVFDLVRIYLTIHWARIKLPFDFNIGKGKWKKAEPYLGSVGD